MYPSDLTEAQWAVLEPVLMAALAEQRQGRHRGGRPRKYPVQRVLEAVLYVARTGCRVAGAAGQLSSLAELSPAVSGVARQWPVGADQRRVGSPEPSPARARHDPHSSHHRFAKRQNGAKRGQRGYDAGKRIKGRKRHIAVDRSGHLLAAVVHGAGVQDSAGARLLLPHLAARYPTVRTVYADGGYQGTLLDWASQALGMQMSIVKRTLPKGFQVLPKRWVVERTLAWLGWNRRLSKDYELNPKSSECFLLLAAAMVLLRRTPSS